MANFSTITEHQRGVWGRGDFHRIGVSQVIVGELLCRGAAVRARERVLDVAAGAGNTSLAAARRGAEVTASDFVAGLLETAERRAEVEGLPLTTQVADAQALPFPDGSFDVVLSTFGVMFAPDQEKAASELLRVCRPGGRIGLACWTPEGLVGQQFQTVSQRVAPPPGLQPPSRWGTEARLAELFGDRISSLEVDLQYAEFCHASSRDFIGYFRQWFGPYQTAFEALDPDGQADLERALTDELERFNAADDGTLLARAEYLQAVAVRS